MPEWGVGVEDRMVLEVRVLVVQGLVREPLDQRDWSLIHGLWAILSFHMQLDDAVETPVEVLQV